MAGRTNRIDLAIAGGGLAGTLAALALAERRPELNILLVEGADRLGGNHVWSFFDADVGGAAWLTDPLVVARWPRHDIAFPDRRRTLDFGYNSVRSDRLHAYAAERLGGRVRFGAPVAAVESGEIVLAGGDRIAADGVVDARGAGDLSALDLGWQKFVGRRLRFRTPHGLERPIIMDATVAQIDGYRFVYCLPFDAHEMMVEDTYYSEGPELDVAAIRLRIDQYVAARGWGAFDIVEEEHGVLPVALDGNVQDLWADANGVARIGLRGGFFHPTTGYSLPDAVRTALLIAEQPDLSSAALHGVLRQAAERSWAERGFYRMLNRMLFRAEPPTVRYRVLEHFYRLPEAVVARFYAGGSTWFDKARVLTGKPPVPMLPALKAAMGVRA